MRPSATPTFLLVSALFVLGCGGAGGGGIRAVRARAAHDLRCGDLDVVSLGGGAVVARGCGMEATYTCVPVGGWGRHVCSPDRTTAVQRSEDAARPARPLPRTWSSAQVEQLRERLIAPVERCLVAAGRGEAWVQVSIGTYGGVSVTGPAGLEPNLRSCVSAAAAEVSMEGSVEQPRDAAMLFHRGVDAESTDTAQSTVDVQSAVRAAVDSRAPAILACVDADAVAVVVTWSATGVLDARIRGEQHTTADEQCVRAVVGALTVPGVSQRGELIHAVQR